MSRCYDTWMCLRFEATFCPKKKLTRFASMGVGAPFAEIALGTATRTAGGTTSCLTGRSRRKRERAKTPQVGNEIDWIEHS